MCAGNTGEDLRDGNKEARENLRDRDKDVEENLRDTDKGRRERGKKRGTDKGKKKNVLRKEELNGKIIKWGVFVEIEKDLKGKNQEELLDEGCKKGRDEKHEDDTEFGDEFKCFFEGKEIRL